MATNEAYMLQRNLEESKRLDEQHHFSRALVNGNLIQPSIPQSSLRTVADVGTGTGVWLREAAQELAATNLPTKFTGFDISGQQFPKDNIKGADFVLHDIVQPFPRQYHGYFDLVHVRLLSYALKVQNLTTVVENIVQIIRPGGYLQWQEFDAIDSWADPDTANARSTIAYTISERVARGLTPAIATPLLKAIQTVQAPVPLGKLNPVNWTEDLVRIMHLETFSTTNHPSVIVEAGKRQVIMGAAVQFLEAGVSRRQGILVEAKDSTSEAQNLEKEVEELKRLLEAWKQGEDPACNHWECAMTSIIAKKAIIISEHEAWMIPK